MDQPAGPFCSTERPMSSESSISFPLTQRLTTDGTSPLSMVGSNRTGLYNQQSSMFSCGGVLLVRIVLGYRETNRMGFGVSEGHLETQFWHHEIVLRYCGIALVFYPRNVDFYPELY
jgi:hypothetical protein